MPYSYRPLPEYPCHKDVWDILKEHKKPIVIYGMGNGADKLIRRFELLGISFADIFASDGFVRGHSFHGIRVKSFSEIKELYRDFVIVLSFASNRREVIEMLEGIDRQYEMFAPDMPVSDETEYFDKDFYNSNYAEIEKIYNSFADEESKSIYSSVFNYRLSGKISYLLEDYTEKEEMYSLLGRESVKLMIDAGAYNGDTAKEAIAYFDNVLEIVAIEPDRRNFKKLSLFAENSEVKITPINAAVWNECKRTLFADSGNRNSSVSSTASYKHQSIETNLISIDSLNITHVDYIKYDVEGAESEALIGSLDTIKKNMPLLLVSLYHRSGDIFKLPTYIKNTHKGYKAYLRRLYSIPAWEINLILKNENDDEKT